MFYTSGTAGDPKGARHTDATIMATARGISERLDFQLGDRNGVASPAAHIAGITWLFAGLLTGGTNILAEGCDPQRALEVFRRQGVTLAGSGTPFHVAYLEAQRRSPDVLVFPDLKSCVGGGATKPPRLHHAIKAELGGAGILSGWGMSEAPFLTMATASDGDKALATTEGKPMPAVDLRVVTLDDRPAEQGEEGELRAKAPQLMRGYVDPSLDAEAFDSEGYFRTGDLGTIDANRNVRITGRVEDIIIRDGEHIPTRQVEVLLAGHPKVADVVVLGLSDARTGERACAVVTIAAGHEPLDFAEMADFLIQQGLRRQAVPEQLEIVEALPRNPMGKILKHQLRERLTPPR